MEPWEQFDQFFVLRMVGHDLWQAFRISDMTPVSPQYKDKSNAIYYVQQELKAEMEKQVEKLLGASDEHIRR